MSLVAIGARRREQRGPLLDDRLVLEIEGRRCSRSLRLTLRALRGRAAHLWLTVTRHAEDRDEGQNGSEEYAHNEREGGNRCLPPSCLSVSYTRSGEREDDHRRAVRVVPEARRARARGRRGARTPGRPVFL